MNHTTEPITHKAKKRHRCSWCWELIEPGDEYRRYRFYDGGDAGTVKMHPECFDAMQDEARDWGGYFEWTPGMERPQRTPATQPTTTSSGHSDAAVIKQEQEKS